MVEIGIQQHLIDMFSFKFYLGVLSGELHQSELGEPYQSVSIKLKIN